MAQDAENKWEGGFYPVQPLTCQCYLNSHLQPSFYGVHHTLKPWIRPFIFDIILHCYMAFGARQGDWAGWLILAYFCFRPFCSYMDGAWAKVISLSILFWFGLVFLICFLLYKALTFDIKAPANCLGVLDGESRLWLSGQRAAGLGTIRVRLCIRYPAIKAVLLYL